MSIIKINIKIGKKNVALDLTANKYDWQLYCKNEDIEFSGVVCNGHYTHDNRGVVPWNFQKEFTFFYDEIKEKVTKELRKIKIIQK